ncbi:MAG: hypothetical protein ABI240_02440 [Sphingomonas sp.]
MRQVNEAELMWNIKLALRWARVSTRKEFASNIKDAQDRAEHQIASKIVSQLRRYEVLSGAPLPEGSDLFSRAAFGSSEQTMLGDG